MTSIYPEILVEPRTDLPFVKIRPPRKAGLIDLRELWEYRELLYFLIWRDIKVRYKQTAIGVAWVVLQPVLTMVIFSIVFGKLLHVPTGEIPYPIFTYTALLPWTFFASAISRSGNSLVYDANLISKVYFPRILLPLAGVLANLVDFGVAFLILIGMMLVLGMLPGVGLLAFPLFLLLALVAALAFGLWLSALNVKFRDINYVIPFLVQVWLFLTPVAYSVRLIPERWRLLYSMNPMVVVVEGFRWALLGQHNLAWNEMLVSILPVLILFVGGLFYFRTLENEFTDVV